MTVKKHREALRHFEVQYWTHLIEMYEGNMTAVAKAAGMNRTSVYRTISLFGLRTPLRKKFDKKYISGQGRTRHYAKQFRLPMSYPLVGEL
jgi:hypothetical protein